MSEAPEGPVFSRPPQEYVPPEQVYAEPVAPQPEPDPEPEPD